MQAVFTAGSPVHVVFRDPDRHHRLRATVAGATDATLVLDLGEQSARPRLGDDVTLVVGSRIFESVVNRIDDRWATVRRPELMQIDDQRRSTRIATRLRTRWRLIGAPGTAAVVQDEADVVDLSTKGARLLGPRCDPPGGAEVELDVGRHRLRGWVRRVEPHEHGELTYVSVEFAPMPHEVRSHVWRTLGKVRVGEHDWA